MTVKIVTDSSCDISLEEAHKLSITIIPLYIQIGSKSYRDGIDLNIDELHKLGHAQELPKTSAPSPGDFLKVYSQLSAETDQIISIHLSSGYSGVCNVASLAKTYLEDKCRVEVIDSNTVSAGLALIVIASARAAQEGQNLDQIVEMLLEMIPRVRMFGKTDSFPPILKGRRFRLSGGITLLGKIGTALGTKMLGEVYNGGKIRSPVLTFGQARALKRLKRIMPSYTVIAGKCFDLIGVMISNQQDRIGS